MLSTRTRGGGSDTLQSDIYGGDWRPNAQTGVRWPDCQPISRRCSCMGIAVPGGCEAAVHATRRFIRSMRPDQVLVKLDFTNAFNSLRRDIMLNAVYKTIPEIYPFVLQAYSATTVLRFGHLLLTSEMGTQQGDPLGLLLFSLQLQPVLQTLTSEFKIGFLNDVTLGGDAGGWPTTYRS